MITLKKCPVVMLPTEKAGIGMITLYHKLFPYDFSITPQLNKLSITVNDTAGGLRYDDFYKNQHLYILSDEQPKEGDWVIVNSKHLRQVKNTDYSYGLKIIATTDSSLKYIKQKEYATSVGIGTLLAFLPQLSPLFIEKYIEAYNAGNTILDVLVEYHPEIYDGTETTAQLSGRLKVDKSNYITITK